MGTSKATGRGWRALQKGDIVDVVAPGFPCSLENVQQGKAYLESLGLVPRIPKDLLGDDLLCSNSDAVRWAHLKAALAAKDSAAIWCLRGGYGSIRLMPDLAKMKKPSRMKLVVGYSDITTLFNFLTHKWKWPVLHGPLLERLGGGRASAAELPILHSIVFGSTHEVCFSGLQPLNARARRKGTVRGVVTGGNLTVLASVLGTPYQYRSRGQVLFLEDTGERAYRIDRLIQQMRQAHYFDGVKALVLGDFMGGDDPDGHNRIWPLWSELAAEFKFPVFSGLKAGHGPVQLPLPLGAPAQLRMAGDDGGSLLCATGSIR